MVKSWVSFIWIPSDRIARILSRTYFFAPYTAAGASALSMSRSFLPISALVRTSASWMALASAARVSGGGGGGAWVQPANKIIAADAARVLDVRFIEYSSVYSKPMKLYLKPT